MNRQLRRYYYKLLSPAIFLLLLLEGLKEFILPGHLIFNLSIPAVNVFIFVLCATMALGIPVFYRAFIAHLYKNKSGLSQIFFLKFQKNLLSLALSAVYIAVVGFSLSIPDFYKYACVLFALYAAYYYYPSDRRLNMDRRIYRSPNPDQIKQIKNNHRDRRED